MPEPSLADVMRDLHKARKYLFFGILAGLITGFIFIVLAVPQYRATMLIAPAERATGPDIKALLPDNSSFAVQYMMNTLGSQDSGDYIRFEHMLHGASVAARLLKDERFMDGVARANSFVLQGRRTNIDTPEELASYLTDKVVIETVGTTPLRRLIYKHRDRGFATYMLRRLHEETDNIIREEIRGKTNSREAYLRDALSKINHPDHRRAMTSLLMEQEHVRMILAMNEPFSAIIAEPPSAGVSPYWPRKKIVFPAFIFAGMVVFYFLYSLQRLSGMATRP